MSSHPPLPATEPGRTSAGEVRNGKTGSRPLLDAEGLRKAYRMGRRTVEVLRGVSLAVGAGNSRERLQKAIVDAWRRLLVHNPQGTLGEGGRCAESFEVSGQQRLRPGDVKTRERVQVASWSYVDLRDPDGKQIDGTAKAFTGVPRAASDHRLDARITRRETQDAGRFQIVRHVQHDRVGAKQGHSWRIPCADAAGEWRPFARTPVRRASGALSNRQIDAALPCGDAANLPAVGVEDEQ